MNTTTKIALQALGVLLLGFVFGILVLIPAAGTSASSGSSAPASVGFEATYEDLTTDDQIRRADAIFVGQVRSITAARFNQDSGEYWQQDGYSGRITRSKSP